MIAGFDEQLLSNVQKFFQGSGDEEADCHCEVTSFGRFELVEQITDSMCNVDPARYGIVRWPPVGVVKAPPVLTIPRDRRRQLYTTSR